MKKSNKTLTLMSMLDYFLKVLTTVMSLLSFSIIIWKEIIANMK